MWQILLFICCSLFSNMKTRCSRMHSPLWFNERRKETIAMAVSKWALKGSVIWGHAAVLCRGDAPMFFSLCSNMMINSSCATLTSNTWVQMFAFYAFVINISFTALFNYSFMLLFYLYHLLWFCFLSYLVCLILSFTTSAWSTYLNLKL